MKHEETRKKMHELVKANIVEKDERKQPIICLKCGKIGYMTFSKNGEAVMENIERICMETVKQNEIV